MYKYRHLHLNNQLESGVITNKWYQSAAITPACCQSAHSWNSACQFIARLLHQSASRVACSVCVTPPSAFIYSLLKFLNYLTLICSTLTLETSFEISSCRWTDISPLRYEESVYCVVYATYCLLGFPFTPPCLRTRVWSFGDLWALDVATVA